ncbi:hypothetical protein SUNI508_12951 [Seiridium unicorne]|uniref:Uncharacterized protein n=1 Tax=Seiridium unicorne TaxID=138068 RepID=A0ABR2VEZ6_9PEZI
MVSSEQHTPNETNGANSTVENRPSISPNRRSTASGAGNDFTALRLAAFLYEPQARGNRNVMLADQPRNPDVTTAQAESSMAEQIRRIMGCCIQQ